MAKYSYRCNQNRTDQCCFTDWIEKNPDSDLVLRPYIKDGKPQLDQPLTWEVEHGMEEQIAVKCPNCKKLAYRVIMPVGRDLSGFYFRGNCYLDKAGCNRDMNLYKLRKNDPYGHMRQPGEKDQMISDIKRIGTKKGKSEKTRKYFT